MFVVVVKLKQLNPNLDDITIGKVKQTKNSNRKKENHSDRQRGIDSGSIDEDVYSIDDHCRPRTQFYLFFLMCHWNQSCPFRSNPNRWISIESFFSVRSLSSGRRQYVVQSKTQSGDSLSKTQEWAIRFVSCCIPHLHIYIPQLNDLICFTPTKPNKSKVYK